MFLTKKELQKDLLESTKEKISCTIYPAVFKGTKTVRIKFSPEFLAIEQRKYFKLNAEDSSEKELFINFSSPENEDIATWELGGRGKNICNITDLLEWLGIEISGDKDNTPNKIEKIDADEYRIILNEENLNENEKAEVQPKKKPDGLLKKK